MRVFLSVVDRFRSEFVVLVFLVVISVVCRQRDNRTQWLVSSHLDMTWCWILSWTSAERLSLSFSVLFHFFILSRSLLYVFYFHVFLFPYLNMTWCWIPSWTSAERLSLSRFLYFSSFHSFIFFNLCHFFIFHDFLFPHLNNHHQP